MSKKYKKDLEQCCMNCINFSCRVPHNEKVGVDENGMPMGAQCIGFLPPKKENKYKKLELVANKEKV